MAIFSQPKNKTLARQISIRSPAAFGESIRTIKKGGVTTEEKKALILAQTRARLQLQRKTLSNKERSEMSLIAHMKLPEINKRKRGER